MSVVLSEIIVFGFITVFWICMYIVVKSEVSEGYDWYDYHIDSDVMLEFAKEYTREMVKLMTPLFLVLFHYALWCIQKEDIYLNLFKVYLTLAGSYYIILISISIIKHKKRA